MGLKREGTEQLSIQWELGIWDDGYIAGQVTYTEPQVSDLSKPSAAAGKFPSDARYASRIFNPLHVLGNRISVSDIDGLKTFKLCEHPEIWKETIEGKKRLSTLRFVRRLRR